MTLLGKIFTMLIFIMSLVWMSFAVSTFMTQKNWREVVERPADQVKDGKQLGLKWQLKNVRESVEKSREEYRELQNELHRERTSRAYVLAALEEARQIEADLRRTAEATHAELLVAHREAAAAMAATQGRLDALKTEVADARLAIKTAQLDRDKQLERVIVLTDDVHAAEDLKRRLEERQRELGKQIGRMHKVLRVHGLTEFDDVDGIPPVLDGFVLDVRKSFLEVSIGSDDGIMVGHELEVFQDRTYKGRVIVRRTAPDRAVAEIIPELRKGEIQKGDRVRTRTKSSRAVAQR